MSKTRLALANVPYPTDPENALQLVLEAMNAAAEGDASLVCFPECIVPGYRIGAHFPKHNPEWMRDAWNKIDAQARRHRLWVILGTEREVDGQLRITARVTNPNGELIGFQDKVQLDPSEEGAFAPGTERRLFDTGELKFGVVICHEGWRYPETVRWAARRGAHIVFHPHVEILGESSAYPSRFADPENSFHEKATLCRAAENTVYFATVNCALPQGAATTSAVIDPEGQLLTHQPYGKPGVLFCDIDISEATGLLAKRLRPGSLNA